MSDAPVQIAAQEKHPCPACGAQAEWSPAKQKLVCPFCGTESPYVVPKETGPIAEIDLLATLSELPEEQRGWNTERRSVQCQSCKAIMVFDPAKVGQNCEFCGSPALVAYEEIKSPIRPQSLLPFKISQDQVRDRITGWYASKWFAPGALKHKALVDQIKGLYIPVLDLRRSGPLSLAGRGRLLLLRHRGVSRQRRPHPGASGPSGAVGASRRRARSFLRR